MQPFVFDETNTFCISLEKSTDRWTRMLSRFQHFGLNVQKWKASTQEDLIDPFGHYLNSGERGCAQSHINIWKHIVNSNLPYAFVLEDDACFDKEWKQKLDIFCQNNTDTDWHAIFLNASEPISIRDTWVHAHEQYLTAGYIISRKGAETLLHDFGGCFYSSDWMTSRLQNHHHSYCYFPWLIIQEGKDSTIGCKVDADHAKVVRCLQEIEYSLENYL